MTTRPRVIVVAYACEPDRGSEPGAGWGLVRAIAEFADCVVLVGPTHEAEIMRWSAENPDSSIRFVTVPERAWPAAGQRGRLAWFISYLRWLPLARRKAQSLQRDETFDLAWHATYSVYWLPSFVHQLGIPSIWGPVGGAVTTPAALLRLLGLKGAIDELVDRAAVWLCAQLPSVRATARGASIILVQNEETRNSLPSNVRESARVLNHALFAEAPTRCSVSCGGNGLLIAGALERRKGVALALRAMQFVPGDIQLTIAGDGPERAALEHQVQRAGLAERVHFRGSVPRDQLQALFAESAGVLFTGLREEGGLALAEAMYSGTPVIVLSHGGAAAIAATASDTSRIVRVSAGPIDATARSLASAMTLAARNPMPAIGPSIDRRAACATLADVLRDATATAAKAERISAALATFADQVTVVIPAFNAERYLHSAARSVLDQTHRALTLVIVDDGSTDATLRIAQELAVNDSRVHVVHTPNGGRARARNLGARAASDSEYTAFLDADDVWDRTKLAEQLRIMRSGSDAAGVGSFMRYVSSSDRVLGETGQVISEADREQIARGELAPFPISSCLLLRSAVFSMLGGFDEGLREAEDLDFIARLARVGIICTVARALGSYRIHPDSAMARSRPRVNMFARFVRSRLQARDAGGDLTWSEFAAKYRPSWRDRRRDMVEIWYRSAALWRGEGRMLRAIQYATLATLAAPAYTLRRVMRQRLVSVG